MCGAGYAAMGLVLLAGCAIETDGLFQRAVQDGGSDGTIAADAPIGTDAGTDGGQSTDAGGSQDALPVDLWTTTFRNNVDGYRGTLDTSISGSDPGRSPRDENFFHWDGSAETFALLRFENVLGSDPGQVPRGATIHRAIVSLEIVNDGDAAAIYEARIDWDESTTWDSFGSMRGVQAWELGDFVASSPSSVGSHDVDVTASLARWSADPDPNHGWIFAPGDGENGVDCASSEHGETNYRPRLVVDWSMP